MEGLAPGGSPVDRTGPWFARAARAYTGLSQVMRVPAPAGAQWLGPKGQASVQKVGAVFHAETTDVLFRAARALLDKGQAEIAVLAKLGLDVVKDLERGTEARRPYAILREWCEEQGVKFTGWGDIASRRFYGVGVRWRS